MGIGISPRTFSVRLYFFIAISIAAFSAYGQDLTIKDSFDSNVNSWWEGDLNGGSQHIRDGKLKIDFPDGGWVVTISPYVAFEKDFIFQATVSQLNGPTNGTGLTWGYGRKANQQNEFLVSSTGYYYISNTEAEGNSKKGIKEWVKSPVIKLMPQANVLAVEQKNGTLNFSINGTTVFSTAAFKWSGSEFGVISFSKMSTEFDDMSFTQKGIAINLPPNLTKGLIKENLGPNINTAADDLTPIISADRKTIYFGREYYEGNLGGAADGEDFYFSNFDGTSWSVAQNMGSPINSQNVNNVSSISTDNNTVVYADVNKFIVRQRNESSWGEPQDLGVSFTNEANHFEGMLSSDGKAVLFSARNSSNLFYSKTDDERDIYVSVQQADGHWMPPLNLGKTINTYGDEVSPFLAADGRTLYYSTNGKPGYGGTDVFMSKRTGSGWTQWTEPVNLGPEINSTGFDAYYVIPASGAFAYMVSDIGGFGKADIVQVKLPKEIKPDPVVLIHGKTLDAKTRKPVSAEIHIDNLVQNKEVGEAISDPQTGDYKIVLPYGYLYGFHGATPGYLSVNENMDLVTISAYTELEKDLLLVPIQVGESIQLNNVFFEQAKAILKPSSFPELDRLVEIMNANPTMEIALNGYTDNVGRPVSLVALSMDRVGTVRNYMISKGISGKRITGKGYGPENPVVKNDTEEHRRMNRRVEFKITKK